MSLPSAVPFHAELDAAALTAGVPAWHLAAIMWRESLGGTAPGYRPAGEAGTGDFTPRPHGRSFRQPSGKFYTVGPSGMPEDGQGWGRGLMQIDWAVHNEWCTTHRWDDAVTNIGHAAQLLAAFRALFAAEPGKPLVVDRWRIAQGIPEYGIKPWIVLFPTVAYPGLTETRRDVRPLAGDDLSRAALAAYNAGASGVLQALACGIPAESVTSGQNYVTWVEQRLAKWGAHL